MAQNENEDRVIDHGFEFEQHHDNQQQQQHQKGTRLSREDEASVEKVFKHLLVPTWQNQLTIRAFVVSFFLSVLFSFIVMKLNLTTGIIPSLNVSAGLLGFFFVKTWTKFLEKSDMLKQPFTRQENTVIQTCVVASSGIAFSGKLLFSSSLLNLYEYALLL
ncbi:unnamed protein product [Lathyrus sativus]|nr:unnamed protein product [Lathyrus sativus]